MARKESKQATRPPHAFGDIMGIVLIASAVLLLVAQLTFDRYDVDRNRVPPNQTMHNWIGTVGAYGAYYLFFLFGAASFVLPPLMLIFGLSHLLGFLSYLRRRWVWAVALFVSSLGFFDLYSDKLESLRQNLNAPSAGGVIGQTFNNLIFGHFGVPGATIIFITVYLISLLYLTNFHFKELLSHWIAGLKSVRARAKANGRSPWTPEEKVLAKRASELANEARLLQEEVKRTGLGADMQPVPEPTIRDLSVQESRPAKSKANRKEKVDPEPPDEVLEGEVITAKEIAAATTEDVLGRKSETAGEQADRGASTTSGEAVASDSTEASSEKAGRLKGEADEESAGSPLARDSVNVIDNSRLRRRGRKSRPITVASAPKIGNYQLPPMELLQHPEPSTKPAESKESLMANARLMQQTLAQFNIEVSLGDITKGPTITRYELHPAPGVKLEKIVGLNNNIAAALKAERINILAPIPGKSSVGVEVPNTVKTKVILRDLLESDEWNKTRTRIPLALGKDVYGHPIVADLADMPHLLIAGSTGSGKSVCINSVIASLLYRFPPDQLRFVMIDPKVVELQHYNSLPHLVVPVVTDPKKVVLALRWVVNEMEKRYQIFAKVGVRNIKSFNDRPKEKPKDTAQQELPLSAKKEKIEPDSDGFAVEVDEEMVVPEEDDIIIPEKLSYIVVIIDELADLMLVAPADVEMNIARITQMARAAGIHCIVATQRPSVDVITGVIKANIPARIAFQVASKVDSRTILDAMGADKLLGKGDMLYLPPGSARLIRAQGALITDQEIQDIVDFIAKQGKPSYEFEIHKQLQRPSGNFDMEEGASNEDEEIIQQCIEVIRSEQKASVSLMQRRLRLGYTRAARIMDELEMRGIVGPSKGAEPRDILIDLDGTGADGGERL